VSDVRTQLHPQHCQGTGVGSAELHLTDLLFPSSRVRFLQVQSKGGDTQFENDDAPSKCGNDHHFVAFNTLTHPTTMQGASQPMDSAHIRAPTYSRIAANRWCYRAQNKQSASLTLRSHAVQIRITFDGWRESPLVCIVTYPVNSSGYQSCCELCSNLTLAVDVVPVCTPQSRLDPLADCISVQSHMISEPSNRTGITTTGAQHD
jgi:hypothetical protein